MDGTDNLCSFGLAPDHTGCTGTIGDMASGENHNGQPLVEGRVCRACNNVVVGVRLFVASSLATKLTITKQIHIDGIVKAWVDFCNGGESAIFNRRVIGEWLRRGFIQ